MPEETANETAAPETAPEAATATLEPEAPATSESGEQAGQPTEPDFREQQAAIERRLDAAGIAPDPASQGDLSTADVLRAFTGSGEAEQGQEAVADAAPTDQQGADYLQQLLGEQQTEPQQPPADPRIDQVIDYLAEREERERKDALNSFADQNPDIRKPEVFSDVLTRVSEFAERAGDPNLQSDPWVVEQAYKVVMADRAAAAEVPAAQARAAGAALETGAGAAVEGELSYEDQAKAELKQAAGNTAFPS